MNDFVQPLTDNVKNIYFINGARDGRYPYSHSLLIDDYLIDTGISSRLLRRLKKDFRINNVLLSHWHEDHVSGNRLLRNAKFFVHHKDRLLVENVEKFDEYYGLSHTNGEESLEWLMASFKLENTEIEKPLDNDEIIEIGTDYQLQVIHTPGHTAGHCSFFELNSKIAFLADIDLTNFVFYAGMDSDLIDFEKSIKNLKTMDIEIAVTGHRGVVRGAREIKKDLDKYKLVIKKRDERILSDFSETKPKTVLNFKNKNYIYKYYSEMKEYEIIAEMIMIQKHFDKFLERKVIQPKENGFILS